MAFESARIKIGRGYGWPRPRSRFGGGRVLAITTTLMLSIATPSGHPTPEAAIAFIKQMIDSPSTTIKAPKTIQ
jgi:hypothetical protein